MSAHTPGPWVAEQEVFVERTGALDTVYVAQVYDGGPDGQHKGEPGGRICQTFHNCLASEEACRANALLIAVAPTLYRVAELLIACDGMRAGEGKERTITALAEMAGAAIAKAKGQA